MSKSDSSRIECLVHFDDSDTINYSCNGNAALSSDDAKFGDSCAYFPDTESNITISNDSAMFDLNSVGSYEFGAFIKLRDITSETEANIFGVGDLTLTGKCIENITTLSLNSSAWSISSASEVQMLADTWYHVMLRISGKTISVFIDDVEVIKSSIKSSTAITPEKVQLGGYIGYIDEFAFRRIPSVIKQLAFPLQHKHGTSEALEASDYVLAAGEIITATDTGEIRAGNGSDVWKDLPSSKAVADNSALNHEIWTMTLDDDSVITKEVVTWNSQG